ncbi:MAG TPA: acyltransferase family protein [Thermoanaerobaculia bacterium]
MTRKFELDWLRVIAILILLGYHTGMIFVSWGWHIQSDETSRVLETVMAWFHYWRMPLLLFISGAGTFLALGVRKPRQFLVERHKRLFIPLVFGMLVIVPPQIYFERIEKFDSYLAFYPTVFELVPYPEGGSLSWHHLWFVLYLLVYSIVLLPLFLYLRSEKANRFFDWVNALATKRHGFAAFLIPTLAARIFFGDVLGYGDETHALIDDWNYFTYYGLFFLYGFICCRDRRLWDRIRERRRDNLALALGLLVPFYAAFFAPDFSRPVEIAYDVSAIGIAWFSILTAIGFGQVYLNRGSRLLEYSNEAIYPFYILHQTVIIAIGYHVLKVRDGVWLSFVVIGLLSLLTSMAIYHFMIRPFHLMRLLFGMKLTPMSSRRALRLAGARSGQAPRGGTSAARGRMTGYATTYGSE